jgi:glycosyltransferase involved in cell wall biosynthesis
MDTTEQKSKPKFSIVAICKNEAKTLPKMMTSLKDFMDRGGEVVLVDTGSTDGTAQLARSLGCKVTEVGEKFITTIDEDMSDKINSRFIIDGEQALVAPSNRLFDFASARNYATSLAENNMVATMDCDEEYTKLNIDALNFLIDAGHEQFEYQFVFAHDGYGRPAVQFVQSKFFDRRKVKWSGVVHEVLSGEAKRVLVGPETILLEHWQEAGKDHRGNYLVGLALDCFLNPSKDRQSHYLAREMMWNSRPKSAIKEFMRHIGMGGWLAERAQSMIYLGDCHGQLNQPEKQIQWYNLAFYFDPNRREALLKIATFYKHNQNPQAVTVYAKASLEIPWTDYYANDRAMYEQYPHELLYWAYGFLGKIDEAKKHILRALKYQQFNPQYLADTKYYFEYPANTIDGWMTFEELTWIYETAKRHYHIAELGSWKGRSTHAWASGTRGNITAIDTWEGSDFIGDDTNRLAKLEDVFKVFKDNLKQFDNVVVNRKRGMDAVKDYEDKSFDVVFIDAGHTYEDVKADIDAWLPKAKMVLCGHDYLPDVWMGVIQAVDDKFGKPDGVAGSIWYKYLVPKVTFIIPTLGREAGLKLCLESIERLNYPKEQIEVIVIDGEGTVPEKMARGYSQAKGEYIVYASNDIAFEHNSLWEALQDAVDFDLVAFNTGAILPDEGNICEHFMIKKDFVKEIGGEIFDTDFHHVGCDNLLWAKAKKLGEAVRCDDAIVHHYHFSTGAKKDEVYEKGWSKVEEDRALLAKKLKELE